MRLRVVDLLMIVSNQAMIKNRKSGKVLKFGFEEALRII
ncbi:hypothetical protein KSL4_0829 [Leuconostoc inhae]|uniref:Uncharacterized protein n=1 Tax=Leuconostoc inhae TaxID=178001 RepID=A0ABM9V462_9LACO|nr:hypothetical protein KSL4_0829 [Leuconostoc inhae]